MPEYQENPVPESELRRAIGAYGLVADSIERIQEGCIRFCYLPYSSHVPRRYRCQPMNEEDETRIKPVFTSLRYGDAAYGQLTSATLPEIRRSAEDESEMGAYHDLYQPQREENLHLQLDEYLRVGMEAGVFYVS